MTELQKTPLHTVHVNLGAKMVPFAGFDMPVQYSGIIDEHMAVRNQAGIFDVSHMGEVRVTGPHAQDFIQQLVSNDVAGLYDGRAMYTVMCYPDGGIVDDLLVYRIAGDSFLLVINASNRQKDYDWMVSNNPMKAELRDVSDDFALIALQGPSSFAIAEKVLGQPIDLPFYHFRELTDRSFAGVDSVLLSHTGYTGEKGLELYCSPDGATAIWEALMDAGSAAGLKPAGLGARDTLRMEAGYCLYGNDISAETNPLEAGLGWVTKFKKSSGFIGRDSLLAVKESGPKRKLVSFKLTERGIPRHGYPILDPSGTPVGEVTSGTQSPILGVGIGLGYVENRPSLTDPGSEIGIEVRGKSLSAIVSRAPLHKS
ncbi:MAG: glycine cleavage system aminomethyltransferase GcvT [Bacteroidetes bacterium]|nr:glycine cleavage system aminomethyltransferase GcvT [Bacteroidota bacterium]